MATTTPDLKSQAYLYIDRLRPKYPNLARVYSLALSQGPGVLATASRDIAFQNEYAQAKKFDTQTIQFLDQVVVEVAPLTLGSASSSIGLGAAATMSIQKAPDEPSSFVPQTVQGSIFSTIAASLPTSADEVWEFPPEFTNPVTEKCWPCLRANHRNQDEYVVTCLRVETTTMGFLNGVSAQLHQSATSIPTGPLASPFPDFIRKIPWIRSYDVVPLYVANNYEWISACIEHLPKTILEPEKTIIRLNISDSEYTQHFVPPVYVTGVLAPLLESTIENGLFTSVAMAELQNGRAIMVFSKEYSNSNYVPDVRGAFVNDDKASGYEIGDEFRISFFSQYSNTGNFSPRVASYGTTVSGYQPQSRFVAVWRKLDRNGKNSIQYRVFDDQGSPLQPDVERRADDGMVEAFEYGRPTVAAWDGLGFVIAWNAKTSSGNRGYCRLFDIRGIPVGPASAVSNDPTDPNKIALYPYISACRVKRSGFPFTKDLFDYFFVVTWYRFRSDGPGYFPECRLFQRTDNGVIPRCNDVLISNSQVWLDGNEFIKAEFFTETTGRVRLGFAWTGFLSGKRGVKRLIL